MEIDSNDTGDSSTANNNSAAHEEALRQVVLEGTVEGTNKAIDVILGESRTFGGVADGSSAVRFSDDAGQRGSFGGIITPTNEEFYPDQGEPVPETEVLAATKEVVDESDPFIEDDVRNEGDWLGSPAPEESEEHY